MAYECGTTSAGPPTQQTFGRQDRSCTGNCFASRNFPENPAKLAAVRTGRTVLASHRLDVGAVQRSRRPETVKQDADGAVIAALANDDPFPAGEIWASRGSQRAHPDAGPWRQPRPFFGRLPERRCA